MRALSRNHVRNVLVNANLYRNSLRLKSGFLGINKNIFNQIDQIYTGSEELRDLLKTIYNGPIEVSGDTRFDQVSERAAENSGALLEKSTIADRRVIVYGSIVQSDLDVVTKGIAESLANQNYLHILVPHEVRERDLIPWEVEMYRHKLKSIRLSEIEEYAGEPVIIWDSIGQLADLYQHADLAYIGAGFSTGVHSVAEAAVYSVPAAHGPEYDILAEAIELVKLELSTVINSAENLTAFIKMDESLRVERSIEISKYMQQRIGASDLIISQEIKF